MLPELEPIAYLQAETGLLRVEPRRNARVLGAIAAIIQIDLIAPTHRELQRVTGYSSLTVQEAVRDLREQGIVSDRTAPKKCKSSLDRSQTRSLKIVAPVVVSWEKPDVFKPRSASIRSERSDCGVKGGRSTAGRAVYPAARGSGGS